MRVRMLMKRMTGAQADRLHYYLLAREGVMKVTVSERTMDATILFEPGVAGARDAVVAALAPASRAPESGLSDESGTLYRQRP